MMEKELSIEELIKTLRRGMVETGSLLCLGCGHEHNCSTHGCAIMRQAADVLKELTGHKELSKLWLENKALKEQLAVKSEQLESLRTIFYEITGSVPSRAHPPEPTP